MGKEISRHLRPGVLEKRNDERNEEKVPILAVDAWYEPITDDASTAINGS